VTRRPGALVCTSSVEEARIGGRGCCDRDRQRAGKFVRLPGRRSREDTTASSGNELSHAYR
jgi:hypothetical protein